MRPVVPPKFIRVKDEPEAAATRSFGLGAVLWSGAWSRTYTVGDSYASTIDINFRGLASPALVRFNYTASANGITNGSVACRLAMDVAGGTANSSSYYSSIYTQNFIQSGDGATFHFSGTAYVPAGDHDVSGWLDDNLTIGSSSTPFASTTYFSESWSIDVLNPLLSADYNIKGDDGDVDLAESFTWLPFQAPSA